MTDPVPSKEQDYLAKLQDSHPMVQLQREVDRLQRQQTNLIAALGEAQAKIDELSIHAAKWVKRATTPAHEREMPHCSTCACPPYDAKALDEARRFKVGDEVPIAHWGETSKIVSIHCTLANGETIAVDCIAPEPAQAQPIQKAYIDRIHDAEQTVVGDVWTKRRKPEHFVEILGRAGHSRQTLILRHWNGRVTNKWYSYLASDYELTKRATQPPPDEHPNSVNAVGIIRPPGDRQ